MFMVRFRTKVRIQVSDSVYGVWCKNRDLHNLRFPKSYVIGQVTDFSRSCSQTTVNHCRVWSVHRGYGLRFG